MTKKQPIFICLWTPDSVREKLKSVKGLEDDLHMTFIYRKDVQQTDKKNNMLLSKISAIAKKYKKIRLKYGGTAEFNNDDKSQVALLTVTEGAELYTKLVEAVESVYGSWEREFGFTAHMTLHAEKEGKDLIDIKPFSWTAKHVGVVFGNTRDYKPEEGAKQYLVAFKTGKIEETLKKSAHNILSNNLSFSGTGVYERNTAKHITNLLKNKANILANVNDGTYGVIIVSSPGEAYQESGYKDLERPGRQFFYKLGDTRLTPAGYWMDWWEPDHEKFFGVSESKYTRMSEKERATLEAKLQLKMGWAEAEFDAPEAVEVGKGGWESKLAGSKVLPSLKLSNEFTYTDASDIDQSKDEYDNRALMFHQDDKLYPAMEDKLLPKEVEYQYFNPTVNQPKLDELTLETVTTNKKFHGSTLQSLSWDTSSIPYLSAESLEEFAKFFPGKTVVSVFPMTPANREWGVYKSTVVHKHVYVWQVLVASFEKLVDAYIAAKDYARTHDYVLYRSSWVKEAEEAKADTDS